jgi:hypothetical protein
MYPNKHPYLHTYAHTENFSVDEVLVFAERLGVMTAAPANFIEGRHLGPNTRPPAPQQDSMSKSRLLLSLDELITAARLDNNATTANAVAGANADQTMETTAADTTGMTVESETMKDRVDQIDADTNDDGKVTEVEAQPTSGWKPGDSIDEKQMQQISQAEERHRAQRMQLAARTSNTALSGALDLELSPGLDDDSSSDDESDAPFSDSD